MKVEPLHRYAGPQLPTHDVVEQHPELLRLLPRRWQANSTVVAALSACLAMSVCSSSDAADRVTNVAPIFAHGRGYGSFGCVAVNPPIFLSESEARQVIIEEARRAGIRFSPTSRVLKNITMPTNVTVASVDDGKGGVTNEPRYGTQVVDVQVDGVEQTRNIAFEYVSEQDLKDLKTGTTTWGMVTSHDTLGTAKALVEGINKTKPGGTYGVFYDPAIGWSDARKTIDMKPEDFLKGDSQARSDMVDAAANRLAKEELRKQVQDFIKWLKAQGVV